MKKIGLVKLTLCAMLVLPGFTAAETAPLINATGQVQVPKTGGGVPGTNSGNAINDLSAARPFGNIDIAPAGTTPETVRAWSKGRSAAEKSELSRRCGIINNPNYTSHYPMQAQLFCRNYVALAQPSQRVVRRCPGGPGFC